MNHNESDNVTFQVTGMFPLTTRCPILMRTHTFDIVGQLTVSFRLPKHDIRVTVGVGDVSKITCSGQLSEDGQTVTWNHPFLL